MADPMDQPARTLLAWRRTLLALVGVAVIVARGAWILDRPVATSASLVALLCSVTALIESHRRLGRADLGIPTPLSPFVSLLTTAASVLALACAALALAWH